LRHGGQSIEKIVPGPLRKGLEVFPRALDPGNRPYGWLYTPADGGKFVTSLSSLFAKEVVRSLLHASPLVIFHAYEVSYTNQDGEVCVLQRFTLIGY
jgi:hypothetical protein